MKRFALCILIIAMFTGFSRAQELGLRFGDIVGNNVAIDGVFGFKGNRIHADVSFGDGVGIEALADLIIKPIGGEAIYYYIGLGAYSWLGDPFQLGISSELGLEYRFNKIPIVLGLDWRPTLRVIDNTDLIFDRFGLNVRYVF
jgi:hypothetical protein